MRANALSDTLRQWKNRRSQDGFNSGVDGRGVCIWSEARYRRSAHIAGSPFGVVNHETQRAVADLHLAAQGGFRCHPHPQHVASAQRQETHLGWRLEPWTVYAGVDPTTANLEG